MKNVDQMSGEERRQLVDQMINIIEQNDAMKKAIKDVVDLCLYNIFQVPTSNIVDILKTHLKDVKFQKPEKKGNWYVVKQIEYCDRGCCWSDYRPIFNRDGDVELFETAMDAKKYIDLMKEVNPKWSTLKLYIKDGKTNKLYKPNKIGKGYYKEV